MARVRIAGAGLAGSAAALAAMDRGLAARLWDPAKLPRHKVCGEFLTAEIEPVLQSIGLWDAFLALQPARMERMRLIFARGEAEQRLPSPAFGLSRYALDPLLRGSAEARGAQWVVERVPGQVDIVAHGRQASGTGQNRLFGFKAHYHGPVSDAVELYFFDGFYVGVNPIEGGVTNVCGLGPEAGLRAMNFRYDDLVASSPALRERLASMKRAMEWLSTGPLVYQSQLGAPPEHSLLAGDALQFVDPFSGTGMTVAMWTGALAGQWVAEGRPREQYYEAVRTGIAGQFRWCGWLRAALRNKLALAAAPLVPPQWLYAVTRPKIERR